MAHGDTTSRDLLVYAWAIAGNERLLAERLRVKVPQVLNWTMGIEPVPPEIFLKAVDVVVGATPEDIRRSRRVLMKLKYKPPERPGWQPRRDVAENRDVAEKNLEIRRETDPPALSAEDGPSR